MLNDSYPKVKLIRQTIQEIEDAKVKILILEDQLKRIKKDTTAVHEGGRKGVFWIEENAL